MSEIFWKSQDKKKKKKTAEIPYNPRLDIASPNTIALDPTQNHLQSKFVPFVYTYPWYYNILINIQSQSRVRFIFNNKKKLPLYTPTFQSEI